MNSALRRIDKADRRKLIMRFNLIIIMMTTCLMQVSAGGFAQRLTYAKKNTTLAQVFTEIKKQTGYKVLYSDQKVNDRQNITVNFKSAPLNEVLEACLKHQSLSYEIEEKTILIKAGPVSFADQLGTAVQQLLKASIDVQGVVKDAATGELLAGASVRVKGTAQAVSTNSKGEFILKGVDENAVLQINYLGYKVKEVAAKQISPAVAVQLELNTSELDEVQILVNTGYQTLPKERATGSFTHISNEKLNEQIGPNIISRLDGVAGSMSFDRGSSIRPRYTVRGLSSINGNQNPLIILDNFPYEGDLNNINPNDIESIDLLKDAQASSIWGARAGNGVIVIVTKKGALNQPLKINLNTSVTLTGKPDLFDLDLMSTGDFIDVEQVLFSKGRYTAQESNRSKPELSKVVEYLIAARDKKITSDEAKAGIDALRGIDVRNEASKYLYNTAVNQQYALSFQGGSNKNTYNISAGYDKGVGVLSDKNDRINLRAVNTFKPLEQLQINTSLYYTNTSSNSGKPAYNSSGIGKKIYPYTQLKDADGNDLAIDVYRKSYTDAAGGGKLLDWKYYPLQDYKHNTITSNLQSIVANAGLNYEFMKGLSLDLKYQYENQQIKGRNHQDINSFNARDLVNRGSVINSSTGIVDYVIPYGGILANSTAGIVSQNSRAQLNFNQTYGDHSIVAIGGSEIRSIAIKSNSNTIYGYNDELLTTGRADYKNQYVDFLTGFKAYLPDVLRLDQKQNNFVSFYGNAAYTYKQKYTVSGSVRKDMSNLFGVRTNDKGVPLWSAGAAWNLSSESFYDVSFVPFLKLRATYGESGNLDSRRAAVTTLMGIGSAFYTNLPQSSIDNYPDPNLRWERVKMFNIGADFQLINNILSGSVEYYHKKGVDLFGLAEVDYTTTGVGTMTKNVADMKGNGVDVELNSNILNRALKWSQNFNFSYNTNKVSKYYKRSLIGSDYVNDGSSIFPLVGHPVYGIVSQRWAGLDPLTGDPQGYIDGEVSKNYTYLTGVKNPIENMVFHGSVTPVVFGNFTNSLSWKSLTLSVNVTYKMGHYFRRASIDYTQLTNADSRLGHSDYAKRWQKEGDEKNTNVPSFLYPNNQNRTSFYNSSEVLVSKADHIRLQFVNLSYSLKKSQIAKLPFQSLQFYANASNLGVIWRANKYGIDPEYNNTFNPKGSYSLGLRADF